MRSVANAHKERSLHAFEKCLQNFKQGKYSSLNCQFSYSPIIPELKDDPLIHNHLSELYDTMLQQNLCRIIEPYSFVEISHVADLINLDMALIEKK